jgi:hypothetical protein
VRLGKVVLVPVGLLALIYASWTSTFVVLRYKNQTLVLLVASPCLNNEISGIFESLVAFSKFMSYGYVGI